MNELYLNAGDSGGIKVFIAVCLISLCYELEIDYSSSRGTSLI